MVSILSLAGMGFTLMVVVLVPMLLAFLLYRRTHFHLMSILVGALVFIISQLVIRIPLLNLLSKTSWHQQYSRSIVFLLLVYALSAGIFEESGRLIGFRFFRKKHLDWKNAVAFGIGHGGIEALVMVGNTYLNNLIISILINVGGFDSLMAPALGEQAQPVRDALISTPSYQFFLAGIERMAVMPIHIALSVLVCLAVVNKKPALVFLAILLHGVVNAPAALLQPMGLNMLSIELILIGMAVIAIYATFRMKSKFPV